MDKKKAIRAAVPFIEVFGVDGFGRGRPSAGSAAAELLPQLELPGDVPVDVAYRIRGEARVRAMTVLKAIFAREFKTIYTKEMNHLVEQYKASVPVGTVADTDESRLAT
jgi:hypothetical protein